MATRKKKVRKSATLNKISPKEEILKKLGTALKTRRKQQGFTSFEHYAIQLEIGRALYAKYEAGADMRVSTLFRIIQGMGLKISDFFKDFD